MDQYPVDLKARIPRLMNVRHNFARSRADYYTLLAETFQNKSPKELAELSRYLSFEIFVKEYIESREPEFRREFEAAKKSLLEQRAQSSPKLTETKDKEESGIHTIGPELRDLIT